MRLDINVLPFNHTTYSSSRFVSRMSFPSGVQVSPINAQAFTFLGYSERRGPKWPPHEQPVAEKNAFRIKAGRWPHEGEGV
jgi:hypothetical protein